MTQKEIKMPKRITVELNAAEERYYRAEYKRLGLDKDIGGWLPGPKETMIAKVVQASNNQQSSDSDKVASIMIVMDDWPNTKNEIIMRDLHQILGV